jgi:predicted enzyme related to lactoylglutathione lyase
MPAVDYVPNTPRWVDLGSPDVEASKRFYSEVFGWEPDTIPDPNAGGYTMLKSGGKAVAGMGPLMMEGQPPAWTTYVYVDDLDATAAKAQEAGGTALVPPMDVMGVGRMAVFMDPTGAVFSAWQPQQHYGADTYNEPVALTWNELASRDVETSKAFYGKVFGWDGKTNEWGPTTYTEFSAGGKVVAGMREMGPMDPAEVPPHWLAYFAVEDCDATVEKATKAGATVLSPPMTIPAGRFAVVADPQGAVFAVISVGGAPQSS